jgi:hypothetical protein
MKLSFILLALLVSSTAMAQNLKGMYELKSSKISYLVTYLIKKADGESTEAKGKGECFQACDFLIAAPLKSFISKDSNRDLNMQKATKADQYPLVVARLRTKTEISKGVLLADIEIDFSGVKMDYKNIALKITPTEEGIHAEGQFDLLLKNHKVEKPSLLGVDINDLVPVTFVADWKSSKLSK